MAVNQRNSDIAGAIPLCSTSTPSDALQRGFSMQKGNDSWNPAMKKPPVIRIRGGKKDTYQTKTRCGTKIVIFFQGEMPFLQR